MRKFYWLLPIVLLPVYGCATTQTSTPSPAIINHGDALANTQLSHAIAELMRVKKVSLAKDAFTKSNVVVIHRANLMGRDLSVPDKFSLELIDGHCVLTHLNSKKGHTLKGVTCTAMPIKFSD